jgi:hypothetical protein
MGAAAEATYEATGGQDEFNLLCDITMLAAYALFETTPTTHSGALALLRHVTAMTDDGREILLLVMGEMPYRGAIGGSVMRDIPSSEVLLKTLITTLEEATA